MKYKDTMNEIHIIIKYILFTLLFVLSFIIRFSNQSFVRVISLEPGISVIIYKN